MARILTDRPSSAKSVILYVPTAVNSGFVNTTYYTLIECNDYSIPDEGDPGSTPDPGDADRVLVAGEVAFRAPLMVTNATSSSRWVELQVLLSDGQAIPVTSQIMVPSFDSILVPIQGQRLVKYNFTGTGARLQIRAQVNNALRVYGVAAESAASDHAPDSEA